jgi:hypothetical protein
MALRSATTASGGSSTRIRELQAGHRGGLEADWVRFASDSATHRRRQDSWASRVHGQGLTKGSPGVSRSFRRQMKHWCVSTALSVPPGTDVAAWPEAEVRLEEAIVV